MMRLYVIAEGLTEFNFIQEMLKPHLDRTFSDCFVSAVKQKERFTYAGLQKDVRRLLGRPGSQVAVTTMIDLYKVPGDFPSARDFEAGSPLSRVQKIEASFASDIDDARFISYIQLHEFEALVLCGLSVLEEQHPDRRVEIRDLEKESTGNFDLQRKSTAFSRHHGASFRRFLDMPRS